MPRFSDNEKEIIRQKLLTEGERLFTAFGIKKVSIDELVRAAGISKGSFYTFYGSKEELYMDIAGKLQEQIWREMDVFLQENRALPPRELMKRCFLWMFGQLKRYPMLGQVNQETAQYLYRKLPPEIIEAHTRDDSHELERLQAYGVRFKCGLELATKTMQTLAVSFLHLQNESAASQDAVMELVLDGVLKEIVGDEA